MKYSNICQKYLNSNPLKMIQSNFEYGCINQGFIMNKIDFQG